MKGITDAAMAVVVGLGVVAAISVLFAIPEMRLWNSVMPEVFGLKEISWGQMTCLSLLCGMLLKSYTPSNKD
jgi:hypothetical protein